MPSEAVERALKQDRTIDITVVGRRSGQPRRLEIWFHNLDGRIYISGLPGPRDWYANLLAHPEFTFHLKESVQADISARARPVIDPERRRSVLRTLLEGIGRADELESWVEGSPLVEVDLGTG